MNNTNTKQLTQTSTYLEDALKWLQKHNQNGTAPRQTADDCLSCLSMVKETGDKHGRKQAKSRLIASKYNTLGATQEDNLFDYETKCQFRAIAANFLCSAMSQADRYTLENTHGIDWKTALRLQGPLEPDGTSPLRDSTFANKVSEDRYEILSLGHEGEVSDKRTVGPSGLYDRLGLKPTDEVKAARATRKSLDPTSVNLDLDTPLDWIWKQDLGEFPEVQSKVASAFRKDAKELRSILGMSGPHMGFNAIRTAKTRVWDEDLNHTSLVSRKPLHPDSIWVYRRMAGILAGRALMSCASQQETADKLRSHIPDGSQSVLLNCKRIGDDKMDISTSQWFCPDDPATSASTDLMEQTFLLLSFEDGEIQGRHEVTAGEMVGTLAGEGGSAGGKSSQSKRKLTGAGSSAGASSTGGAGSSKRSRGTQ